MEGFIVCPINCFPSLDGKGLRGGWIECVYIQLIVLRLSQDHGTKNFHLQNIDPGKQDN